MILRQRLLGTMTAALMAIGFTPLTALAESGQASWYSSGGGYTAAHRTLPFGTRVRVTHRRTGRSVVVTINDRGPFIRGRVIDLSPAAASAIGIRSSGVGPVSLQVVSRAQGRKSRRGR
jgi:rare lipoprotein A